MTTPERRLLAVLRMFGAVALAGLLPARALGGESEWRQGTFMTQAVARVMTGARRMTETTGFGLDDGSSCFIGGALEPAGAIVSPLPLEEGRTYAFMAGGDDDVTDLNMALLDPEGHVVAQDIEADASPVVVFECKASGTYRVRLELVSSKTGAGRCAFATLSDRGFDVPAANLAAAYGRLIEFCTIIDARTKGASFLDTDGGVALVGTILKPGETLTQGGIGLGDGDRVFVACADGLAEDIDLELVSADGRVLDQDTEDDANPVLFYSGGGTVGVKISNARSEGATLALAAVLKVSR